MLASEGAEEGGKSSPSENCQKREDKVMHINRSFLSQLSLMVSCLHTCFLPPIPESVLPGAHHQRTKSHVSELDKDDKGIHAPSKDEEIGKGNGGEEKEWSPPPEWFPITTASVEVRTSEVRRGRDPR